MTIKHCIFILLLTLSNSAFSKPAFKLFVNNKLMLEHSKATELNLLTIKALPDTTMWKEVVVFSDNNKKTFYSNWHANHGQTRLLLQPDNNAYSIQASQPHKSITIDNAQKLLIVTTDYTPEAVVKIEIPPLAIHKDNKTFLVDKNQLDKHKSKKQKHGWPADWLINKTLKSQVSRDITLKCKSQSAPLFVPKDKVPATFIRLNRQNFWRATVTNPLQNNKSQWQRCKNLTDIYIK